MSGHDAVYPATVTRKVPWDVTCHLAFSGKLLQIAIIPFFVGIAFMIVSVPAIIDSAALKSHVVLVPGYVYLSSDTGQTRKAIPIYENRFAFTAEDGTKHTGVSFGAAIDTTNAPDVTIRYSAKHPEISAIVGQAATRESASVATLTIIPFFIGLILVIAGLFQNYNIYSVLRQGILGSAILSDKQQTRRTVNQHPVFHYVYDFTPPSGRVKRLTIDTFEWIAESTPVLYSNDSNEFTALVVAIPGKVTIINNEITSHATLFQTMIIPLIAVVIAIAIVVAFQQ